MSDRHNGFVVIFDKSIKDEDSEKIKDCLLMIKNVISVEPVIDDLSFLCAKMQVRNDMRNKMFDILTKD